MDSPAEDTQIYKDERKVRLTALAMLPRDKWKKLGDFSECGVEILRAKN